MVAKVASRQLGLEPRRERWRPRADVHRPGSGVLAEQRPLRTAQDFHSFQIEEIKSRRRGARVIDLIDIETHSRLQTVIGLCDRDHAAAQTPDGQCRIARIGRGVVQGGHQFRQL